MDVMTLKDRFEHNRISLSMLKVYVRKGVISKEDFKEITGQEF